MIIDASEQIAGFHQFIEQHYYAELYDNISKGNFFLIMDFMKLSKKNPDLSHTLLEMPSETIKAVELAIDQFDLPEEPTIKPRFINIPQDNTVLISEIRSKHLGKLIRVIGNVRQKSDVRPQMISVRFECPSCGTIIGVLQMDKFFREPNTCNCGRRGKFRQISKQLVDMQGITLEECSEQLEGGNQPRRLKSFLSEDLVTPLKEKRNNPGSTVSMIGYVEELPLYQNKTKLTRMDLIFVVNALEVVQEDYYEIEITKEEEKEILTLSKSPDIISKLTSSFAPSINGHDEVKEAMMLQMFGGIKKLREDESRTRGDIHILIMGDPGVAKSQLLKRADYIAPKSKYVSGKGASGVGLTVSVVKDDFLKGWALEAGALVLCHKGNCYIDEFDKMSEEDSSALHEALEQQTVTVAKANIQARLYAETTVTAAANPKWGKFDPHEAIVKQIEFPPTLLNRFDLIFILRDISTDEKDKEMVDFMLNLYDPETKLNIEIDTKLITKYIAYAKQKIFPKLTKPALQIIKEYWLKMRKTGREGDENGNSLAINARQLEGIVRISEAAARARLSNNVEKKDALRAVKLTHFCLNQVGLDPETGKIDINRVEGICSMSEKGRLKKIKGIIKDISELNMKGKTANLDNIRQQAEEYGIDEDTCDDLLEQLKRGGDIFEPKRKFYQILN